MSHKTNRVKAARLWLLQRKGPRNVNLEGGNTRTAARLLAALAALAVSSSTAADRPGRGSGDGPFQPSWESLKQYRCPEWFRDAKLGIWAVWGPEAVPMQGDWYARQMYEEGSPHYTYHLAHYGHPSKFGYKDIIPLWKAERWDPDRLMALYKQAGAKYFCVIAQHHDNFDCWNSKFHKWNSVNLGPKRDIVGEWKKAADRYGLRFGVTEHLGASYNWYSVTKRADKAGPLAGVPYDGADPRFADLYHAGNKNAQGWLDNVPETLETRVVQSHPGPAGQLPARPALFRQRLSVRRDRPPPGRPFLQPEPARSSRQTGGRVQLQTGSPRHVGAGPGTRHHGRYPRRTVADRHLRRRLVLRRSPVRAAPLQVRHARAPDAGRHRQQERQPAPQLPAAPRRHAR